jgi:hypothetical protein
MKKAVLAAFLPVLLGASLVTITTPASADANLPVAHIKITKGTNTCTAPNPGPKIYDYNCSYFQKTVDVPLTLNNLTSTPVAADGRIFHLTLREVQNPPNGPLKFKVSAAHRKNASAAPLSLVDMTVKANEAFSFRFPVGTTEAVFLDITIN